jgi:glutathione S-transferase
MLLVDQPYEFVTLNIFDQQDRAVLIAHNPARKVPMLLDGEQIIFDSGVIYRYLAAKLQLAPLSWQQENQLTLINAANDSLVELLLCQRSGFDIQDDKLFFKLQHERIEAILSHFEEAVKAGQFQQWDYLAMSLYSLLDWLIFREMADLSAYPTLRQYLQTFANHPAVLSTDPRHN